MVIRQLKSSSPRPDTSNTLFLPRSHRPLHAPLIAVLGADQLLAASGTVFMQRIEWISYDWRIQHLRTWRVPSGLVRSTTVPCASKR
jgi:hypothetical protein